MLKICFVDWDGHEMYYKMRVLCGYKRTHIFWHRAKERIKGNESGREGDGRTNYY
jgi:hypothetical protein